MAYIGGVYSCRRAVFPSVAMVNTAVKKKYRTGKYHLQNLTRQARVKNIAITGIIASGKSSAINIIAYRSKPLTYIFNCDLAIHLLINHPIISEKILKEFGISNRKELSDIMINKPNLLPKLEAILYPELEKLYREFIFLISRKSFRSKQVTAYFDIPLLFEKRDANYINNLYDEVWSIVAKEDLRRNRYKGSPAKFDQFNKLQKLVHYKKKHSTYCIVNNLSFAYLFKELSLKLHHA